ncbi:PadR family transcriptional regulator [Streptomyces griseoluteus]|uniref:PadR family transcriptional regulator n=1 Tax=Streptomyces griseoluteus TaxID=29306 RepID=UPI0036FB08FB
MTLRNAVMATLLEGEASGYDLAKGFNASVANFWTATPQQVYRELDRMEREGLVTARVVRQDRRPDKRLFSLTDAGHDALRAHLAAPITRPTAIRDGLLVKVQCADIGDPAPVQADITAHMDWSRAKLARYERLRERLLAGRTEDEFLAGADRVGPYLTLLRGIAFEEENLRWGELALRVLAARSS